MDRIIFKAVCACINFIITFGIAILVPRILGPIVYGEIGYINASATFLLQFSSVASSTAYIYFISNDKYDINQVNTVYAVFITIIVCMVAALIGISISNANLYSTIWTDVNNVSASTRLEQDAYTSMPPGRNTPRLRWISRA